MRPVTAQWIANAVGGELAADVDALVIGVEKDSREIHPGWLYVAFIGERVDGHDFITQAVANGAVLSLVSRPVDGPHVLVDDVTAALGRLARAYLALLRAEQPLTVIGITGSNGKTTTKDLLAQVLPDAVAPVGSFNNEIGLPLTVLRADATTRHLVLEMGASGLGHIAYLTDIAPLDVAVGLIVGTAHMGEYASPDDVAVAKSEIVRGLMPGGVAVLNADDARVAAMASLASRAVMFGIGQGDVAALDLGNDRGRASFEVRLGGADGEVLERRTLALVGEHHVTNALAALAVALECGIEPARAWAAVAAAGPISGHRMALTERADGVVILDDSYNASIESMRAAFRALKHVADGGRTFAVIGEILELGDQSIAIHDSLGVDVVRLRIDHTIVVGDGARPAYVAAVREGSWGDEALFVATIGEAREVLDRMLAPGDTVLVKASHGSGLWELADDLVGGAR
ncbi:UDP-N-acetylmuramoyl-tripeptide--D-alanyl-D-alanine ligase [Demequina sp. SYSU T00039]|uniref:UDP-N-acetylmuramoyl-tripeptide--D-alanyl-D-alanine ligase n=1 Tax=Demequina lignilytica TaxID=3051663 RepID=A0AAW7M5L9_9MICO|nr:MULTISPECIES: UDP-N-acetylmuramoyl-tripeptide--D-alanyl-D-alanine ligase [unclassified Demequina]MDN4477118.1 UDP-N-acetylmuramoyl-tripeptide--D-alanyl-D-alanine ligase [Demequina sp. SYSU T00039-1]MDN4487291.1 UDP-N-acetylmuramoyl-tripeptide--D-alanyl-D-alanine ligase [Demequina sp. SYSU T00039]MDN4491542.1 UDP-N-acetylmuramoyl-tripeptide--D-alanyl-D-alanine ligase [Demequina sp. SYSU T00068]